MHFHRWNGPRSAQRCGIMHLSYCLGRHGATALPQTFSCHAGYGPAAIEEQSKVTLWDLPIAAWFCCAAPRLVGVLLKQVEGGCGMRGTWMMVR